MDTSVNALDGAIYLGESLYGIIMTLISQTIGAI
jgi:hypothetical protein